MPAACWWRAIRSAWCRCTEPHDAQKRLRVASEMKALVDTCADLRAVPAGPLFRRRQWRAGALLPAVVAPTLTCRGARPIWPNAAPGLRACGGTPVDEPGAARLGLDSLKMAAVAARYARRRIEDGGQQAWWPRLHSFAIGPKGSPGCRCHCCRAGYRRLQYTFEGRPRCAAGSDSHRETYDVTTIRASTPMFLLARRIKAMGVKMVLSGEGQRRDLWWLPVFPQGAGCA